MKKNVERLFLVCIIIIFIASCDSMPAASSPTIAQASPTPYNSAPQDPMLDLACRVTINFFFSYKQGFPIGTYRNLFIPSSQHLADGTIPPAEAPILLDVEPASQWWQENLPATPMPQTILPRSPNEYFYYVKFTGHYRADTKPIITFPASMTMDMITNGLDHCKIKGYGGG